VTDNGQVTTRPCFLVIDREHASSISTRKLVIETAKLNVITAYSGAEGLATLARFPAVNGIVLDAAVRDMSCTELVRALKQQQPDLPLVLIGFPSGAECQGADYELESFDPAKLLTILRGLVPQLSEAVDQDEEALRAEERRLR
jgi:CheY-like chemotaxis protein